MNIARDIYVQDGTVLPNEIIDTVLQQRQRLLQRDAMARCQREWSDVVHHVYGKTITFFHVNTVEHGDHILQLEKDVFRFHDMKNRHKFIVFHLSSFPQTHLNIEFQLHGYVMWIAPSAQNPKCINIIILPREETKRCILHDTCMLYHRMRALWRNFIYFLFVIRHKLYILKKKEPAYVCVTDLIHNFLHTVLFSLEEVALGMNIVFIHHCVDATLVRHMFVSILDMFRDAQKKESVPMFMRL